MREIPLGFMPQGQVTFINNVPADAGVEATSRPNWHAFGMLVAWSGAGGVIVLSYILAVAHSLDSSKLGLIATWLVWLTYLALLARAALLRSYLWNHQGPATIVGWGLVAPLLQWGIGKELRTQRGYPAVEAMIVTCVNVFNSALPLGGVVVQHALFLSVASMELWARSPTTGTLATGTFLLVTATNFFLGIPACCLMCLAHNRQTSRSLLTSAAAAAAPPPPPPPPSPSPPPTTTAAAAGAPGKGPGTKFAAADTRPYASAQSTPDTQAIAETQTATSAQVAAVQEGAVKNAEQEPSSKFTLFAGSAFSASQPNPSLKPSSAHPGAFSWTPALARTLSLKTSLIAWVQRAELWLLAAVSQEDAKVLASLASAMFLGTRFLASVANYSLPGIVASSPTMDMLAIVLGMMMGGSPNMQGWAAAQMRAYRSVRGLLRSIMPAHVADALEAYETERDHARPMCTFGVPSSTARGGHSLSRSRSASRTSSVVSSWGQSFSHTRRASYSVLVGLTKPGLGPSQPSERSACSLSGNLRSCLPTVFQSTPACSASHLSVSSPCVSGANTPSGSEIKLSSATEHSGRNLFSERHEQVTLLFADIVGFTTLSEQLHPSEVMNLLSDLYREYDECASELGLYTVDTIGDCYMCAANLVKPLSDHAHVMVGFARSIMKVANATLSPLGTTLSIRVGIHTGPLMSGVLGAHHRKFTLLGDTVNVASRMETTAIVNSLQISERAYKQLRCKQPATLSESQNVMGQSVYAGGCGNFPDVRGRGQGKGSCCIVRGSSAPPSLLARRQASLFEPGSSLGRSTRFRKSMSLHREEQLQLQEQGQGQQLQEGQGQQLQEQGQEQGQGKHCQEEEKQHQCFSEQTGVTQEGGQNKLHSPESQGAVTSLCTAALAEQRSPAQQPGGIDLGPTHPQNWLERELIIKGKGIMKAYTYVGPL